MRNVCITLQAERLSVTLLLFTTERQLQKIEFIYCEASRCILYFVHVHE